MLPGNALNGSSCRILSGDAELGVRFHPHLHLRAAQSWLVAGGACGIVDLTDRALVDTDGFGRAVLAWLTVAGCCVLVIGWKRDYTSCAGRALG